MKIALDFDGTYTRAPALWRAFIRQAQQLGHQVYIVTARDERNDGIDWNTVSLGEPPVPVIFCDGRPKEIITEAHGLDIDVWIDDNPSCIIGPTAFSTPEQLKAWREQDEFRGAVTKPHGRSRGLAYREKING
jgi:hypothetical protein